MLVKTAYLDLVKTAIRHGFTVSVWDGGEWQVKKSAKIREIANAIKSVEEAELRFRDAENRVNGWALVSAYGLEPEETVTDYSDNEWMNAWADHYHVWA